MARQLVFTSAPQGLTPGRTGYCTVARHGDLRERLVPMLESLSVYPSDWQPAPVICSFRLVEIAGTCFPVLSRIVDAGFDYTHRGHYLAHHLILDPQEFELAPPPAEIFLRWSGWLTHWEGPARWLGESDWVDLAALPPALTSALPAQSWENFTGDAGCAALLLDGTQPGNRVLRCPAGREGDMLYLLRESSALLSTAESWRAEFTTCLQPAESPGLFRWVAVRAASVADAAASRAGNVLDLTQPETLPPAPANAAARKARGDAKWPGDPAAVTAAPMRPAKMAPAPPLVLVEKISSRPVKASLPPAAQPRFNNGWLVAAAALVIGVLAGVILLWPHSAPPAPSPAPVASAPPPPLKITAPAPASALARANTAPPAAPVSRESEQTLLDIVNLADEGKFLEALGKWKDFAAAAPDYAQTRSDVLRSRLLPGARQEWMDSVDKISAQFNAGAAPAADLAAQLAALRKLIVAWPFNDAQEMDRAAESLADKFQFLDPLPHSPVWIVDSLAAAGKGADYQDVSALISIPALDALLGAAQGKFHVSAAAATSLALPPAAQWFNFDVQGADFESTSFLILHDTTRGKAGGRFLQLLQESPGKTQLTWRLFTPDSDFFRANPANAPLGPISRELWLHFVGEPPLPSFYLLLHRPDNSSYKRWTPVSAPLNWLAANGAPAKVTLPSWLGKNLVLRAAPAQSFQLEPANLTPAAAALPDSAAKPVSTADAAQYDTTLLIGQLTDKVRESETNLARAQKQLQDVQTALSGPVIQRPPPGAVDQAAAAVKKIQQDMDLAGAAARAAALPEWPASAGPWLLTYNLPSKEPLILLQFNR